MAGKIKSISHDELTAQSFRNAEDWNNWLSLNHQTSSGIWIRFFKKYSGVASISHAEALDVALCYGWIDGQLKKIDDKSWLHKFTPRRAKSIWSKKNTVRAEQLLILKKMKPSGLKEMDNAKIDGRWSKAYDSPGNMNIPADFLVKLSKNKKALSFFNSLNRTNKYSISWRLQTAKKPETRLKRMDIILDMLSNGEKFH